MDPFNPNQNNQRIIMTQPDRQTIEIPNQLQGYLEEDKPSSTERFMGKAVGTLTKFVSFILLGVGITSMIILLRPFIKLVIEFSDWAYNCIDKLF
jgi:hypothetical protein